MSGQNPSILVSFPVGVVGGGVGEGDDGGDRGEGGGVEDRGDERLVEEGLVLQPDHGIASRLRFDVFRGEADGHEGPDEGDQPNGNGVCQVSTAVETFVGFLYFT